MKKEDCFVHEDIEEAYTLPPFVYTDPGIFAQEKEKIFQRSWLFVPQPPDGNLLQILSAALGRTYPFALMEKPIILRHDKQLGIICLSNVCTHMGSILYDKVRRDDRFIICPLHRRMFTSRGEFLSHRGCSIRGQNLKQFRAAQWKQFFFVCLDEPYIPFSELLNGAAESLFKFPIENFIKSPGIPDSRIVEGNWKLHVALELDPFHLPYIHKTTFAPAVSDYHTHAFPSSFMQWAYTKDPKAGIPAESFPQPILQPGKYVYGVWLFIPPNLTLNLYAWGLSINVYMPIPKQPDETCILWYHYVADEKLYRTSGETNTTAHKEDDDAVLKMHCGMQSGFYQRERFLPDEYGIHWFQRWWYRMMYE